MRENNPTRYGMLDRGSHKPAKAPVETASLSGRVDTVCEVSDCSSSDEIDYDYDTAGRLKHVNTRIAGIGTRGLDYTLDANGNRIQLKWPQYDGGYTVSYCYDHLNRMTGAYELPTDPNQCDSGTLLATYAYNTLSRRKSVTYASGASMAYTWSNAGDLLTLNHNMNGGTNDPHYTFTYTNAHELQTETNSDADYVWQPSTTPGTTSYAAANSLNQYPAVNGTSFAYDPKGNLTGDGTWTFGYDAENRMLTADKTAGGTVSASYAYDPLGRRTHKSGTGVTERYFLNDGDDPVLDYDGSKNPVAFYVPGPAIDEPIVMSTPNGGGTYAHQYYHTNHQGSVIATSDDTGAKQGGPYLYDPYGNCFKGAVSCANLGTLPFAFTGQRLDPETGLYYYRARCYSPTLGRFCQTDPVGYDAGMNPYAYVDNNPVNKTDPTGKIDGFTLEDLGFVDMGSGIVVPQSEVRGTVAAANAAPGQVARFSARMAYELSPVSSAMDIYEGGKEGDLGKISLGVVGLLPVGKAFSAEKAALREMARIDKRLGITEEDFQAYKELNSTLSDPFPEGQFHGPEAHPNAPQPTSRQEHYHAAGVSHIPARRGPDNSLQLKTCVAGISITTNQPCGK